MSKLAALLLSALLLAACVPTSLQPLSPVAKAQTDARLPGTWIFRDEKEVGYLHIADAEPGAELAILQVTQTPRDGAKKDAEYVGHASHLDSGDYLNLRAAGNLRVAGKQKDGYLLVRYRFDAQGYLEVGLMNAKPVHEAIERGALAGEITEHKGWADDVRITATPEALRRFVNARHAELFTDYVRMQSYRPFAAPEEKRADKSSDG